MPPSPDRRHQQIFQTPLLFPHSPTADAINPDKGRPPPQKEGYEPAYELFVKKIIIHFSLYEFF
jgi:hypothetical protein